MIRHLNGRAPECVIVDLNTQHDFCDPAGALPVANLQALLPALRRVVRWGEANDLPVISSVESHRSTDVVYGGGVLSNAGLIWSGMNRELHSLGVLREPRVACDAAVGAARLARAMDLTATPMCDWSERHAGTS